MLEYIDGVIVRDKEFDDPQVDEDYPDCKRLFAVPFQACRERSWRRNDYYLV